MALTDTKIKKLVPTKKCLDTKKPDKYSDMNGLQLWIRYTGVKSWVVAYRFNGKQVNHTLGQYPYISLAQARELLADIKTQLAQGIDPKEFAKQAKIKQADNSFCIFGAKWLEHQQTRTKANTFKRDKSAYHRHIETVIGDKDIYSLKLPDIMAVHDRLALAGKTSTARRAISWINAIYDYTIEKGLADGLANPIPRSISKSLVEHTTKHYPRIKVTELPQLLDDIDNSNSEPLTKYGFYVLCYTFVRTSELRGMRWEEIDFDTCLWHIPAERMKNKLPHIVPLAPQVIKILQNIKAMKLHDEFVFFSNRSRKKLTLSENAFTVALKRLGYQGRMTGHGFRGLASTSLYEMQYPPQAIELQLSHAQGNKTVRAYNEANLLPARVRMMNEWADIVDEIKGGNFDTYKHKRMTDQSEQAFISFLKAIKYKDHEILDELAVHRLEMVDLMQ